MRSTSRTDNPGSAAGRGALATGSELMRETVIKGSPGGEPEWPQRRQGQGEVNPPDPDEKLRPLFGGRSQVTMFDLAQLANTNLS